MSKQPSSLDQEVAPPSPGKGRRAGLLALLLLLLGAAVYSSSLQGEFVFDDIPNVAANPALGKMWPPSAVARNPRRRALFYSLGVNYHIDRAVGGDGFRTAGYHLGNLAIHLICGLVLFDLTRRTLYALKRFADRPLEVDLLATAVAAVWLVHPLGTQAVSYIIQRGESMMAMLFLLTLYCTLRGAKAARPWVWYAAAAVCCSVGMITKEVMIAAPLVLLLFDRIFLSKDWRQQFSSRGVLYLLILPAGLWLMTQSATSLQRTQVSEEKQAVQNEQVVKDLPPVGREDATTDQKAASDESSPDGRIQMHRKHSVWEYARTQPGVVLHYLRLAIWPRSLCFDYLWQPATNSGYIAGTTLVIVVLLGGSIWLLFRGNGFGFLGAAFFLILAPTSSLLPIKDMAVEHRMYLPLTAVCAALVLGGHLLVTWAQRRAQWSLKSVHRAEAFLLVAIVIALGSQTFARNYDFRNAIALWQSVLRVDPTNPRANLDLAELYLAEGDDAETLDLVQRHVDMARQYVEDDASFQLTVGYLEYRRGNHEAALRAYRKAERELPLSPVVHARIGEAYEALDDLPQAIAHYRRSTDDSRRSPEILYNLGRLLVTSGEVEEGVRAYRRALALNPDHFHVRLNLGQVLAIQGDTIEAADQFMRAAKIEPLRPEGWTNLGLARMSQRNGAAAMDAFRKAAQSPADDASARQARWIAFANLARSFQQQGNTTQALAAYRQANELVPSRMEVVLPLVRILATDGDTRNRNGAEAVVIAEAAVAAHGETSGILLDALAAAYAEAGRFDDAVTTIDRALAIEENEKAVAVYRQHRALFAKKTPLRLSVGPGRR